MRSIVRVSLLLLSFVSLLDVPRAEGGTRRRAMRSGGGSARQVTTFDVIDRAAAEGRISAGQAVLYKVFSIFDDPRFPAELRGDDTDIGDTLFMTEVAASFESLPAEVREQVAPFLIPPFHRNSWWDLRRGSSAASATELILDRPCTTCPISLDWKFVTTANGRVKVWYLGSEPRDAAKAAGFRDEIDNVIWPKLVALMGRQPLPDEGDGWLGNALGGDDKLDIALLDIRQSVTTARYSRKCDAAAWAYIQFNKSNSHEELAHELMHAFQYAFHVKARGGDCTGEQEYRWLMESTAEWVKDYIYPASTSPDNEQWAARHFLQEPESPLDLRQDPHWYGAYLLPFFLDRIKGQPRIVGQIWANTERAASLEAVEQALQPLGGFEDVWPEFALHNWNQGPIDDYERLDGLTRRPKESGDTFVQGVDHYARLNVELPHLSATYKHFVFNDRARSVAFLNGLTYKVSTAARSLGPRDFGQQFQWTDVPEAQKRGASVQAILKIGGRWQEPENWTGVPFKAFCRQKAEERIEEIVLIFANSNTAADAVLDPPDQPPLLIATEMPCRWTGTLSWVAQPNFAPIRVDYSVALEPRDPMLTKDSFLGFAYETTGHASWSVTGKQGACTYEGSSANAALRTDRVTVSFNFAPQGSSSYRKAYFLIALQDSIKYTLRCPQGASQLDAGILGAAFPFPDPLLMLPIGTGGRIQGESQDVAGTWKWDFKAKE